MTMSDLGDYFHLGDIVLTKGLEGGFALSRDLIPCDGRSLGIHNSEALRSLLGKRFDNGSTVPDLTRAVPIEGATYYMVVNGAPPPRR